MHPLETVGLVVIGRNEGERLHRCLQSAVDQVSTIVYVDSGSTDDSVAFARSLGVSVVELDLTTPFTAARARNAGLEHLLTLNSQLQFVQFIDGDMELVAGWLEAAQNILDTQPEVAAVCGCRRERYPERSIYNRICDVEWRMGTIGESTAFGGDVMIRISNFVAVGGYNPAVIAAEDDELAVRLRQHGGKIIRIDQASALHDANIYHFSQWWNRAKRCGYAYALVSSLHGASPERKFVREVQRTWLWGIIMPVLSLLLAPFTAGLSFLVWLRYPLTMLRTLYATHQRGFSWVDSAAWGLSCGLSVFPEALGVLKFHLAHLRKQQHEIIEYKHLEAPPAVNLPQQ